ncbi:hypothetical protein A3J43_01790 [Candidatus Uhrbacteria bacterium RIFCSPHIGHO2_12_FULL_54_23]|uniref:DUF4349 domain-containing protein n=1 Tax=Candidatus Uhrbacteria bacterium RIFCSPHIGHO2_12_FULL_54_23 TaxID=1802397 RepID=A0A1F7UIS0_9BACT|nr:MAG: hypothetical protein A3J43_01790 [Candidatus Uhrbacteria bacterium RIFCSPHIGHO2_12_FULL_54_23]
MQLLQNVNFDLKRVLKIGGITLVALILISLAVTLVSSTVKTIARRGGVSVMQSGGGDSFSLGNMAMEESAIAYDSAKGMALGAPTLSARNIAPIPPIDGGGTTGSDAEAYEVTQYRGMIETRNKDEACKALFDLKAKDYVIFEQANTYDRGCNVTFKVVRDRVDKVVVIVKSMDPKEFVENSHTIKSQVEDYTSEIGILQKKQAVIEDTLNRAMAAYDEITTLATQTRDAESLARVINSKIQTIERLTNERINISTQLDRLTRSKAEQLDKLDYTYFYLNVIENKYLDGQSIKDSWKAAIREFVRDVNKVAQDVSVNLVPFFLRVLQYLLYAFIILVIAKYAWHLAKRIWKGPATPQI